MGGIKTKSTGSLAFFSSAGHARLASLAEQPWFLSSTLFSGCSLLQNFVRFVVLVRFYSTVHTAYIRNEPHDISKGARPNETNSNTGQYCTWRHVNHDDLTDALKNGVIKAAALDVTEPEPLPKIIHCWKWRTLLWHHTLDQQLHAREWKWWSWLWWI